MSGKSRDPMGPAASSGRGRRGAGERRQRRTRRAGAVVPSREASGNAPGRPRLLRTADVLRRAGITHQILYRYVTLGLIEPARQSESGQRWFRSEVVELIEVIKSLNQTGYSLRDLKETYVRDERVEKLRGRD